MKRSIFLASAAAVAALPAVAPAAQLLPSAQQTPIYLRLATSYPGYAPARWGAIAEFDVTTKSAEWIRETIRMMTAPVDVVGSAGWKMNRHVAHATIYSPGGVTVAVSTTYGRTEDAAIVSAVLGYRKSNEIWTEWLQDAERERNDASAEPLVIVRDERDGNLVETFRNDDRVLLRLEQQKVMAAVRREDASPVIASIAN